MKVKERRTLIKLAYEESNYIEGIGPTTISKKIEVRIGTDKTEHPILTDCFYCYWNNYYGTNAIMQQQQGINDGANINMVFVKEAYEALSEHKVFIYKDGIEDDKHKYELTTSVNDIESKHQEIEFSVKRWVGK